MFALQCGQFRSGLRFKPEPQLAHFVGGLEPVLHAARWMIRIALVFLRIVVSETHLKRSSLRQLHWLHVSIVALPVEIPPLDENEFHAATVRQLRPAARFFSKKVEMRRNANDAHIYGQLVR